jgi:ABC-type transport system involved in cytochrome c biogenesis permease subunit
VHPGLDISLFYITFVFYFAGFLAFSLYAAFKTPIWHKLGRDLMIVALLPHTAAFIVRWSLAGHVPLSNMYEYMSLMSWMAVVTLLYVYIRYQKPAIGTFLSPVVFMLMVAAALLPKDMSQSLMPALQSVWLTIHVSMAALGAGCFLIAFAASAVYLVRKFDVQTNSKGKDLYKRMAKSAIYLLVALPIGMAAALSLFGIAPATPDSHFGLGESSANLGGFFVLAGIGFVLGAILLSLFWPGRKGSDLSGFGGWLFIALLLAFLAGGLIEGLLLRLGWLGLTHDLPGADGGITKSAWLIFEFFGVAYSAGLILSLTILPLMRAVARIPQEKLPISLELLDEISYKAVSLGYPLYTVGALFAGAIWAERAWGQFWSWDPKEVGALITWLFFSGYLHARYQRGWTGSRAAALAVAGFLVVLLSFFGNYFFGGMHAYA